MLIIFKKSFLSILLIITSYTLYGQGMVVQGIARNVNHAAISDRYMDFTFQIKNLDGSQTHYSETKAIRTDTYGVFSHIIGHGDNKSGNIDHVDFGSEQLKLIISVEHQGETSIITDEPFSYSPYAYHSRTADNGVPAGTVVPFMGQEVPTGWMLCDGSNIPSGERLIDILGNTKVPDLRGMFLRGSGTNATHRNSSDELLNGPEVNAYQQDQVLDHNHSAGDLTTEEAGAHSHNYSKFGNSAYKDVAAYHAGAGYTYWNKQTDTQGNHVHNITGNSGSPTSNSGTENRPANFGVNYIIKM